MRIVPGPFLAAAAAAAVAVAVVGGMLQMLTGKLKDDTLCMLHGIAPSSFQQQQ
jgi:hypothetical protein